MARLRGIVGAIFGLAVGGLVGGSESLTGAWAQGNDKMVGECKTTTVVKCTPRPETPNVFDCRAESTTNGHCFGVRYNVTLRVHCFLDGVPLTPEPVKTDSFPYTASSDKDQVRSTLSHVAVTGGGIRYVYFAETSGDEGSSVADPPGSVPPKKS